jgi:predicted dehydrogenase
MAAKLTASVVGGGSGGRLSANALVASDLFELRAMTDMREEVCEDLRKRYPGIQSFTRHQDMFSACPTEVVCVSTWPPSHEEVTIDALALPLKGILVEKPLADTTPGGRRILEAIKAKGLPMAVPHNLLSLAAAREIFRRVQGGEIGELRLVEIQCTKWDIINAGIHWMNFFVNLVRNEPLDHVMAICESSTRTFRDGMQVETTAVTSAQTRSGARAVMYTGDEVHTDIRGSAGGFRIVGTGGLIEYQPWGKDYLLVNKQFPGGSVLEPEQPPPTGHQWHLERMASMIGAPEPDYFIPETSLAALHICEGAYISSRHRCKVTFPVDEYSPPPEPDWDPGRPYSGTGGGRDGRKL